MWWQVAKDVQKGQVTKDYHKHQSHQLQPRKLGNLPAKVEVETVDHNQLEWPLSPSSMIDWSHMWWQVAKVVQQDQVAKDYHKHQSHQLQPRKLVNLRAKVEVETVDHNQHEWPLSPSSMIDWSHVMTSSESCPKGPSSERLSQASVSPATATQAWKLACYSWCRDSWSQSAQLANESKSQKMITNISLKQISLAFEAKSDLAEIAKMHVSPATVSASFKLAF